MLEFTRLSPDRLEAKVKEKIRIIKAKPCGAGIYFKLLILTNCG